MTILLVRSRASRSNSGNILLTMSHGRKIHCHDNVLFLVAFSATLLPLTRDATMGGGRGNDCRYGIAVVTATSSLLDWPLGAQKSRFTILAEGFFDFAIKWHSHTLRRNVEHTIQKNHGGRHSGIHWHCT